MKQLLILSILVASVGCGQAPTQHQEKAPAGFKQVVIIDENGAHTVTMPAGNMPPGDPVQTPVLRLPVKPVNEKGGFE